MADIASKLQVKIPELPLVDLDLSSQHLTTTNFMQLLVAYNREVPKGKIDYVGKSFARLYSMVKPPLGSGRLQLSAFFVPYRTVWQPWTDFITDTPHNQPQGTSIISMAPTIQLDDFIDYFVNFVSDPVSAGQVYDFDNGGTHYVLREEGRWALKLFESLGYKVLFNDGTINFRYSALPLLCFAKAYIDYYFPSQYSHTGVYASLDGFFQRQTWYDLNSSNIDSIVRACRFCSYDDNIFINAFDNPLGGANGTFSRDFQIKDISSFTLYEGSNQYNYSDGKVVVRNDNAASTSQAGVNSIDGTPFIGPQDVSRQSSMNRLVSPVITEYSLHNLMALNDYIYRNALAGSRSLDRYLARYGKVLDSSKLQRSIWLGSSRVPLNFGEVVSTSDTSTANLGDYAGIGTIADMGSHFTCDTDEFGQFIVIATIVPDVVYYQGIDENVMHVSKLDFHTAEFDGIGNTPLRRANLMTSLQDFSVNTGGIESVWAFASKYWEYKTKVDHLTGDFRCNTVNGGLMSFSMARMLPETINFPAHNLDFILGKDANQFNRIFYDYSTGDKNVVDHFYVVFRNNVHAAFPVKKLYDSYDWHTDSNKEVKLDVNGAKVN